MTTKINNLTPEQEALIPVYRDKWRAIALSTERINRQTSTNTVKIAYQLLGQKEPKILFFDSPCQALKQLEVLSVEQPLISIKRLAGILPNQLRGQLSPSLWTYLWRRLGYLLCAEVIHQVVHPIIGMIEKKSGHDLNREIYEQLTLISAVGDVIIFDFLISSLSCKYCCFDEWKALQAIISYCPWIFSVQETCLICDRPTKISFDSENRLHAEGEPAIRFADGFSVYAHHGELIRA